MLPCSKRYLVRTAKSGLSNVMILPDSYQFQMLAYHVPPATKGLCERSMRRIADIVSSFCKHLSPLSIIISSRHVTYLAARRLSPQHAVFAVRWLSSAAGKKQVQSPRALATSLGVSRKHMARNLMFNRLGRGCPSPFDESNGEFRRPLFSVPAS